MHKKKTTGSTHQRTSFSRLSSILSYYSWDKIVFIRLICFDSALNVLWISFLVFEKNPRLEASDSDRDELRYSRVFGILYPDMC